MPGKRRFRLRVVSRAALVRLGLLLAVLAALTLWGWSVMIRMPGESYSGALPPLAERELDLAESLRRDVQTLAGKIGERNVQRYRALMEAAVFIEVSLEQAGYDVSRQEYQIGERICRNLDVQITGADRPGEIVIVGAHYDSVFGSPGANDNATGVAAMLALARAFATKQTARTLRFVAFANEEPPHFQTDAMGSRVYARRSRQRGEDIVAMLSLETIGYYSDLPGSQSYPAPFSLFYPSTGNFIGFVGNFSSRHLVRDVVASFRAQAQFPSEGGALPSAVPGVGWSDHWSFWQEGYPALMATDTAPFRYPHYHSEDDTPDKVHYEHMARVVAGLEKVIEDLASSQQQ